MARCAGLMMLLGTLAVFCPAGAQEGARGLVLFNGIVHTVDEENRVAEAVVVEGERIAYVGTTDEALRRAGEGFRRIDLDGKAVTPGFIDAHGHLPGLGQSLQTLNLTGMGSLEEVVALVAQAAESVPAGEWILGRGWDQNNWPEKAFPHHETLSAVSPHNPVYLTRVDGHAGFVNAVGLGIAGIGPDTADPSGGRILRDGSGAATGVLIDRAQGLVTRHIPPTTEARARAGIEAAIALCLEHGITTVHDAGVSRSDLALYREMIDAGAFDLRIYAMIRGTSESALEGYFAQGPLVGYGGDRLTVRSIKCMVDGALGSRGAALLEPYSDEPGNHGLLIMDGETLEGITTAALKHGFQVGTHAIGDRGNRVVLDAYEAALKAVREAADPRLRVEHAQIIALSDIPRFAALGVIPSMQATHATSDMYWAEDRVGPDRILGGYAWRKLLEAGCRIANGSDFPVEDVNPLWGFYAAITRQDHEGWPEGGWYAEERMTRTEALRSFTLDAAYAGFEEGMKGSIEAGKLADLAVLSRDIMTIAPEAVLDTRVVMTILGGKVVYSADSR